MKQRILSILLILCLLAGTIPQLTPAATATDTAAATYSGTCGENLTWTLDTETGVLRISGTGDMYNWDYYSSAAAPWKSHRSYIKSVEIASGVTSIGNYAFDDCTALTSVTIPNSVTTIGRYAFYCCAGLTSITIPNSLTTIKDNAFHTCTSLNALLIPASVTSIGFAILAGCKNLESIQVDAANQYYEVDAYGVLYNKGRTALIACPAKYTGSYVIPDSANIVGNSAFEYCVGLTSVTIPGSVKTIDTYAFEGCSGLSSVTIADGVKSIEHRSFYMCTSLTTVNIPDSVTSIEHRAFEDCTGLISVNLPKNITKIDMFTFIGCTALESIIIPDGVTTIDWGAFYNCTSLLSVTIPDSVTYVDVEAFNTTAYYNDEANWEQGVLYAGRNLFRAKTDLSGGYVIRKNTLSICRDAFIDCTALTSVNIPSSVTYIGDGAFRNCSELTSVDITGSLEEIKSYTFAGCVALKSITMPNSVMEIGAFAFEDCTSLTSVTIPNSVNMIIGNAFNNCIGLEAVFILNPSCEIYPDADTISLSSTGVIYGFPGSTAEEYAQNHGYTFRPLPCQCDVSLHEHTATYIAPTCLEAGGHYLVCNECDCAHLISSVPAVAAHNYERTSNLEPTCEKDGETTYTCTNCGETWTETTSATGHSYEVTSTVEPTYGQNGEITYTCTNCGATKTETIPALEEEHSYEVTATIAPTCEWTGLVTYTCTDCGHTKNEVIPATGHSYDDGAIKTPATCVSKGVRIYTCTVCGSTKVESIPVTEHQHLLYRNNGDDHSVKCITCPNSYYEPHRFVDGHCICGAIERILDETVKIYHSLNLASDIALNYAVRAADLAGYESYFMECVLPIYEGNELLGTEAVTIQPVLQGDFYYFPLTGMTALEMNNMVEATLHMERDGKHYISNTDSYSIATYAYDQLNNEAMPEALRALCANLLRYGAKAQLWKGYRTDALADAAMTEEHKALLGDLESVPFGNNSQILTDVETPVITWVGKTMSLDSKITVRFVVNTANYTSDLKDLSLRISFVNVNGETENITLTELTAYNAARNYYAFDFDGLLSAELRSVLRAAVYAGDTQLSPTLVYSVDTYGTATTGSLRTLVQAMVAYGDSANEFFAG